MLSGRSRIGAAALIAATTGAYLATGALGAGSGTPANKATAAASKRVVVAAGQTETILSATMKTSKPTDLILQTTLECSIFTQLVTNNTDNSATAGARIRAWIEIDDVIVPLEQISSPPQNGTTPQAGTDADKVTFCDREYSRTVTDDEDNVPMDGIDEEDDYISTKSSHGFNWLKMNVGSGIHKIELVATLTTATDGQATATAEIGNRSLIIEPTKMANDAVIGEAGSS
jgi:hypothetical protein